MIEDLQMLIENKIGQTEALKNVYSEDGYGIRDVHLESVPVGIVPSKMDTKYFLQIRKFVAGFISSAARSYPASRLNAKILDIAPQIHEGATIFETVGYKRETADIDPNSKANFIIDITKNNQAVIPDNSYDAVVCTEVLEHTAQPFAALQEIARILRPGAFLFATVPCNFRIHGPLPDSWRFTEYGIMALCRAAYLDVIKIYALEDLERPLFPLDYAFIAQKSLI